MRGREIVGAIIDERGITYAELARRLDVSRAAMWDRVNNPKAKDIYASVMSETLEALGYKLVAVPKNTPLPEESYIVT